MGGGELRITNFWEEENLSEASLPAFRGAAEAPHCLPVPGARLGWAGTEAGEESQGVKVKLWRLALPREVAGSKMKVGDESAQR